MSESIILLLTIAISSGSAPSGAPNTLGGGPDGFGYVYRSTQELGDSIRYQWIDVRNGVTLSGWYPNDDDGYVTLALPFPFVFYGETLQSINICTNGFLSTSPSTEYANQPLPCADIRNLIAPFWDDLSLPQGGTVRYYVPPDSSCCVVAFLNIARYQPPYDRQTFQVVFYPDGRIQFNYQTVNGNRSSSTIGIQGGTGANQWYLQYVADGNPPSHIVQDSTTVSFTLLRHQHDVGAVALSSPAPFFAPGTSQPVMVRIRNFGLEPASFTVSGLMINTAYPYDTAYRAAPVPVTNLPAGETLTVMLENFTPDYAGTWQAKLFTQHPDDEQRTNDTVRTQVSNRLLFGMQLQSWNLDLPSGFALGGITYDPECDRFYLAVQEPNQVFSFAAADPPGTLRNEPFALQSFFGNDVIWGIAYDHQRQSFWLGHVAASGQGTILARYRADGSFSGDTWNLNGISPTGWCAGMDHLPDYDHLLLTKVGDNNALYQLNCVTRQVVRLIPGGSQSYRACSFLNLADPWLLTGGWNQNQLLRLDTAGNLRNWALVESLADCDIYQPCYPQPDSLVWVMATLSNQSNTLKKLALGFTWRQLAAEEFRLRAPLPLGLRLASIQTNPLHIRLELAFPLVLRLSLFDRTGREILSLEPRHCPVGNQSLYLPVPLAPGIYFVRVSAGAESQSQKVVVLY